MARTSAIGLLEALPADLIVAVIARCSGTTVRDLDCTSRCTRALVARSIDVIRATSTVPLPGRPLRSWAAILVLQQAASWLREQAASPDELSEALLFACGAHSEERELYCPRPRMAAEDDATSSSMREHRETRQRKLLPCVIQHGIRPTVAAAALLAGALGLYPAAYDVLSSVARCVQILLQPALDEGNQSAQQMHEHDVASAHAAADLVAGGMVAPLARSAALHADEGITAVAPCLSLLARHGAHGALLDSGCGAEQPLTLLLCGLNSVGTRAPSHLNWPRAAAFPAPHPILITLLPHALLSQVSEERPF